MKRRYNRDKLLGKVLMTGLLLFIMTSVSYSQSRTINFYKTNLKGVLKQAKSENRYVFIDTYAAWCKPCKRMDKVFRDKELSTYFNNNFINYKANMDIDRDREFIKSEYSVVFLPTLIILSPDGDVIFKEDREMSASDLLMAGKKAINPASYSVSETYASSENIVLKKKVKGHSEKTIKILDKKDVLSPNLLREEAYFRLELMDGSHLAAADRFLETQKDWRSQANTDFIMDFTEEVESEKFDFIVDNRMLFVNRYGKERVARLLNMVVYSRLQNGFPRVTLSEAEQLYRKIKVSDPYAYANNYMINRMYFEKENKNIVKATREYLDKRPGDIYIAFKIGSYIIDNQKEFSSSEIGFARGIASDLLSHDDTNTDYQKLLLKYYIFKGDCKKAHNLASNFIKKSTQQKFITEVNSLVKSCNND